MSVAASPKTVYDFTVKNAEGTEVSLSEYAGKVLLIVNTATKCGFTPQYEALEVMYKRYHDRGFEILDFPCNQFLGQAPGSAEEIESFCQLNYGTTFPRFAKIDVNGKDADPLFTHLKAAAKGVMGNDIKWNFTKFLVGRDGTVIERFSPTVKPAAIERHLEELL
jgi:glutathione peroxidase